MTNGSKSLHVPLLAAGLLGLTGVALGAMGAHALKAALLERGMTQAWETAARYHIVHAVAALAVAGGFGGTANASCCLRWAVNLWVVGVVLFCGSLYGLALGGPRWLGPVTPLGGIALLAGWLCVAIAAWRQR